MKKKPSRSAKKSSVTRLEELAIEFAQQARENAYSPYSQVKVGACVITSTGELFTGCNVENSSYGGTICAERTAILKAVSESGPIEITSVAVVTDAKEPWPPCGMCRQVIAEFVKNPKKTRVILQNLQGDRRNVSFESLLPMAFTPNHLKKRSK